jgi:aryl-alcohol dehydrogenase-like predicted oxidoreductase
MTQLGLGTAQLGPSYGVQRRANRAPVDDVAAILAAARERGIAWVDTAPDYGDAEALLGRHLGGGGWRVCTKLPQLPAGLAAPALRHHVAAAIDASRRRLRLERIDCYLLHCPGDLATYGAALVEALEAARAAGAIGRFGASVYTPEEAARVLDNAACSALQYPFSVFDRRMPVARRAGFLGFARSALLQGLLAMAPRELPRDVSAAADWVGRFHALCAALGERPAEAALRFAAAHAGADVLLVGVDHARQLHQAADALARPLAPGFAAEVARRLSGVPPQVFDPRHWTP